MPSLSRTGVKAAACLAMTLAMPWITCGKNPRGGDGASHKQWSPITGPLATARIRHTATLLPSGQVLVTGGVDLSGPLSSAEVYDPGKGAWSPTTPLATARIRHTATLLSSGQVLVTGGFGLDGALASVEVYDPGKVDSVPPEAP